VESAIRARADRFGPNPETGMFDPYPVRLADGLVELCATSGDESSPSVQVTVHADLEALTSTTETTGVAELQAGPVIANATARRLSCDAIIETAVYDDCRVLGVGRLTRTIPGWLRRQLWHRDGGCRFTGCPHKGWIHGHHIQHWADGGPTDLDNLILLCAYHHRFLHEHGWTIEGDPGGKLTFHKPDGRIYPLSAPNSTPDSENPSKPRGHRPHHRPAYPPDQCRITPAIPWRHRLLGSSPGCVPLPTDVRPGR